MVVTGWSVWGGVFGATGHEGKDRIERGEGGAGEKKGIMAGIWEKRAREGGAMG